MLHAPAIDTRDENRQGKSASQPPVAELSPPLAESSGPERLAGTPRMRSIDRLRGQRHQALARAQQTHGNQAVLRMLNHSARSLSSVLQRKCACGGSGTDCAACQAEQESTLQRHADNHDEPGAVPSVVQEVLSSPGQPLANDTRAFMEPRFGHDFSGVRVHTDRRAAASAEAVSAVAYTVGKDIVFAAGKYAPNDRQGKKLIAHELTHIMQQSGTTVQSVSRISQPGDAYEQEADQVAKEITEMSEIDPATTDNQGQVQQKMLEDQSGLPNMQRQTADEENTGGADEELYEIDDQLLIAKPRLRIVALPIDALSAGSPSNGGSVLQRQVVPDTCNTPQTMRKVTSGKFEGGKTLDDYYPDLVGAGAWGKNDTAGPFDNGSRVGSAVQLISEWASPCTAPGPFVFDQSITWVKLRADGKKVAEKGKEIEGQTYDDIAHSNRDKSKAPFRQDYAFAISIADPISGIPYKTLKTYECEVKLTTTVSGPGGAKSVDWGVTMEASAGKVTKNEVR